MITPQMYTSLTEQYQSLDCEGFVKYHIYRFKPSPRRMIYKKLIIDVDDLCLCDSLIGDTFHWFDLHSLLLDFRVDLNQFKSLLELSMLELLVEPELEIKLFNKANSVCGKFLGVDTSSYLPLSRLSDVVNQVFNQNECYFSNNLSTNELRVYKLSLLSDFKGLKYFFNFIIDNFNTNYLLALLKELDLKSISPRLTKQIVALDSNIPSLYCSILKRCDFSKATEYFSIIENIFQTIGGVK